MHIKAPQVTSTFIPNAVTTPLALHVMEDGCIAAPEKDESIKSKKKKPKQIYSCNKDGCLVTMLWE